jgi:hypothetical protein
MDSISLIGSLVGAQAARTSQQIGVAVMRQALAADRAVVDMVAGSAASGSAKAPTGPGIGANLDVTV